MVFRLMSKAFLRFFGDLKVGKNMDMVAGWI